jgi:hypothetical protein
VGRCGSKGEVQPTVVPGDIEVVVGIHGVGLGGQGLSGDNGTKVID